ncbi:MAG: ATP-grasp domain-containing protein [Planctomycetes bacterium]|nr:ATP-grasp domain-containing protein [Planctomycetota bacterium]
MRRVFGEASVNDDQTIGVVGASARAAVHSLLRAGFKAWAVDLFGDRDLAMVAPCAVCPLEDYPDALPKLAKQFPTGPVMYTGGLENHPRIVAELAETRKLWGESPTVLEAVRDPFRLFPLLATAGFRVPAIVPRGLPCPVTGRWLRKPIRSGGGLGIRFAMPDEPASPDHIFQEFIDGLPMSAAYGGTTLLGVSEQLVGEPWLHAKPFLYCGSIGSPNVPLDIFKRRATVVLDLGVRGFWNLDFILRDGQAVPVESNPRYPASVEVFEHGFGCGVFQQWLTTRQTIVGKAIYYAPRSLVFPDAGPWDADLITPFDPWRLPAFADIPAAGSVIPAGQPVITLLVSGSSPTECRERLQSRAKELDLLLAGRSP